MEDKGTGFGPEDQMAAFEARERKLDGVSITGGTITGVSLPMRDGSEFPPEWFSKDSGVKAQRDIQTDNDRWLRERMLELAVRNGTHFTPEQIVKNAAAFEAFVIGEEKAEG